MLHNPRLLTSYNSLPRLHAVVETALKECIDRLGQLPPPMEGEPLTNIMLLVNSFLRDLDSASIGESYKELAQKCRERYNVLRGRISATCPKFGRATPSAQRSVVSDDSEADTSSEDEEEYDTYDIPAVRRVIQEYVPFQT